MRNTNLTPYRLACAIVLSVKQDLVVDSQEDPGDAKDTDEPVKQDSSDPTTAATVVAASIGMKQKHSFLVLADTFVQAMVALEMKDRKLAEDETAQNICRTFASTLVKSAVEGLYKQAEEASSKLLSSLLEEEASRFPASIEEENEKGDYSLAQQVRDDLNLLPYSNRMGSCSTCIVYSLTLLQCAVGA